MRKLLIFIAFISTGNYIFAGDIANFTNIGFSDDSRYFMFAQYGVTDTVIYSEIYTVDVAANSFVKNGVSKKEYPAASYPMEDGFGAFYKGLIDLSAVVKKNKVDPLLTGRLLYININGEPVRDLEFRDFKTDKAYKVNLTQSVSEAASGIESSFSLKILSESRGSAARAYEAGSPAVRRKGVKDYSLKKVFLTPDEKNMVLVIEMKIADKDSVSIRYMVETLKL